MQHPDDGVSLSLKKEWRTEHTSTSSKTQWVRQARHKRPHSVWVRLYETEQKNPSWQKVDWLLPGPVGGYRVENQERLLTRAIKTSQNSIVVTIAQLRACTELYVYKSEFVGCDYISKNVTLESLRFGEPSTNWDCVYPHNMYTDWASTISRGPFWPCHIYSRSKLFFTVTMEISY